MWAEGPAITGAAQPPVTFTVSSRITFTVPCRISGTPVGEGLSGRKTLRPSGRFIHQRLTFFPVTSRPHSRTRPRGQKGGAPVSTRFTVQPRRIAPPQRAHSDPLPCLSFDVVAEVRAAGVPQPLPLGWPRGPLECLFPCGVQRVSA